MKQFEGNGALWEMLLGAVDGSEGTGAENFKECELAEGAREMVRRGGGGLRGVLDERANDLRE
jgi:hypothetical protein